MALPVIPIAAETPAQANPYATSMNLLNQARQGQIQNQYLPATLAAQLMHQQLLNQQLQPQAQLSPQMAQAELAKSQAQAPYMNAQTQGILQGQIPQQQAQAGYLGAEANLTNQTMPYKVQQAHGAVYSDPILQRLFQLTMANKTGSIPGSYLASTGLPTGQPLGQNSQNMPMPNMGNVINNSQQGGSLPPQQILPNNAYSNSNTPAGMPKAFGGNEAQNWALFGSPYNPLQLNALQKGMGQQAISQVDQWNNVQNDAQSDAALGNQLQNFAQQFQYNYGKSTYKGPLKGKIPTTGWETALVPGNLTQEQLTDNASQNAAALVAKLIAGGKVSNYEMQYINNLKPNRMMTPDAAQMTSDFLVQRSRQMQQLPQFLSAAQNQGLDIHTAQSLWNMYRQQRPVYDFGAGKPNIQFNGSWKDYLNPQAAQAVQTGKSYIPIPSFDNQQDFVNWTKTLQPQDRALVKQNLSQGGQ